MKDIPMSLDSKTEPKSSATMTIHGSMTDKMKVGEPAAMKVHGKIKSMRPNSKYADHYDVEIQEPHIEHIDNDGMDENLASMPKEMLKKRISQPAKED